MRSVLVIFRSEGGNPVTLDPSDRAFLRGEIHSILFVKLYSVMFRRTFLIGNVMWDKLRVKLLSNQIYNFLPIQNWPPSWFGCIPLWVDWWGAEGFLPPWPPGNQCVGMHLRFGCLLAPHSGQALVSQRQREIVLDIGSSGLPWLLCSF